MWTIDRRLSAALLALAAIGSVGCGDEPVPSPANELPGGKHSLLYEQTVYLTGLDEHVRIVKSPLAAYGVRADGRVQGLVALAEEDREAYRQRFGPFAAGFHRELVNAEPTTRVRASIYFELAVDWYDLAPRILSRDAAVAASARTELEAAVSSQGEALAEDLFLYRHTASGGTYVWASQSRNDVNEGLDYTVPTGEGGVYDVLLAWPSGVHSCEETNTEPLAYMVWVQS